MMYKLNSLFYYKYCLGTVYTIIASVSHTGNYHKSTKYKYVVIFSVFTYINFVMLVLEELLSLFQFQLSSYHD